ncbi:putative membrane protein [Actinacidiphila reveromycinica]|uniref:Putative membrane protein n=1 Tax=Actinacidiphila reveromycinica TaxID=659352 RepID=A0A7U3VSG8_9ACTN|nr:DMT family transporter [Streptomyces sp. SN-593]BBB01815.1 putative membrane protein [Streptomyces sp. SN-593]
MSSTQVRSSGVGLALLSAVAFGGSGVAAKPLIEAGFEPLHVVWMRVAGAALVLLPVALRHRRLPLRRPGLVIGFGLLGIVGVQALYYLAISRIPVGIAILVEYLGPALLLGWVRFVQRRKVSRAAVVGVVLAVGGMCLVVRIWSGLAFAPVGLLCSFGAACCQVAYFVLADHGAQDGASVPADPGGLAADGFAADGFADAPGDSFPSGFDDRPGHRPDDRFTDRAEDGFADRAGDGAGDGSADRHGDDAEDGGAPDPVAVVAHALLIGTAALTLVARPWDIAWTSLAHQVPLGDADVPGILLVGWIVLVCTVVSYLTGVVAVRRLSPQVAAVVSCVEAVVGAVLAWFLLGEHLGVPPLFGGALVLVGAFVAQTALPGAAEPGPPAPPAVPEPQAEPDLAPRP